MRRAVVAALLALACARLALAQGPTPYGPPPPPAPPDGYARELVGEGAWRFVLWRPAKPSETLLVVADDEPSLAALDRPDLLQIARARKMTVLFLGAAPGAFEAPIAREALRGVIPALRSAKTIGVGTGAGADFLQKFALDKAGPSFDALLLADAAATPPGKGPPFVVALYGSDAFWRSAPRAPEMRAGPNRRRIFLAGAVVSPSSAENCAAPVNARAIEPARRALLVALDEFLHGGAALPASREAELAPAKSLVWPKIPGLPPPPQGERLVPKIDADGNETSGLRLPDQALPLATFTGWNGAKDQTKGECAAGARLPFPETRAAREAVGDPRQSLVERYGARSYFVAALRSVADKLVKERLLLPQDADAYVAAGKLAPF